jgi:hypothetical protein
LSKVTQQVNDRARIARSLLGLTVRTAMLGPNPFPPCRWLAGKSPPNPKD